MATPHTNVVTIGDSASAALIDTVTGTQPKTVLLPTPSPGKFIYIADCNGSAEANTLWISTNGVGLSIKGAGYGPGGMPMINRNYGAMAFLANGTNWYTIINEGGLDTFANVLTSSVFTSSLQSLTVSTTTIWAQTLNLAGGFSPTGGVTTANISANTISTNTLGTGSISNSGVISTLGLNVGALSSINISTLGQRRGCGHRRCLVEPGGQALFRV